MADCPKNARDQARERGFTLIELAAVVSILALVIGVGMRTLAGSEATAIDAAASEAGAALRFARQESIRTGDLYGVEIQTWANRIRVYRVLLPDPTPLFDVRHPLSKQLWDSDFDDPGPTQGVSISVNRNYFGACMAPASGAWFIDGIPFACLYPSEIGPDLLTYTMSRDANTQDVQLDGLTGRVSFP